MVTSNEITWGEVVYTFAPRNSSVVCTSYRTTYRAMHSLLLSLTAAASAATTSAGTEPDKALLRARTATAYEGGGDRNGVVRNGDSPGRRAREAVHVRADRRARTQTSTRACDPRCGSWRPVRRLARCCSCCACCGGVLQVDAPSAAGLILSLIHI